MTNVKYAIVKHDDGWAYRVDDVYSETFATYDEAIDAAKTAAAEQRQKGSAELIEFQDEAGVWHEELSSGDDRPQTEIEDDASQETAKR